ncbi:nucleotidyltransferase substrate binding protein [Thermosulfurimonas sp. F29]|nr:nucleotidyltransferase substrate binding protein [Thermosulfurimonas sp. F29]
MLSDRNLSSHVYEEKTAEEIYERIKKVYSRVLKETIRKLEEKL